MPGLSAGLQRAAQARTEVGAMSPSATHEALRHALVECRKWCDSSDLNAVELICETVMPALEAALRARLAARAAPPQLEDEDEPLHTGDDERLDCVTGILAALDALEDDDEPPGEAIDSIREECQKLDALLIATIKRERASSPGAVPAARLE
jgi:hypothetical protein